MQDKRIDDKFIDQAWEQMLATLNQELPAEEQERRIFPLWWRWTAAASVLLLLTVGIGWWWTNQQTPAVAKLRPASIEKPTLAEDCPEAPMEELLVNVPSTSTPAPASPNSDKALNRGREAIVENRRTISVTRQNQLLTFDEKTATLPSSGMPTVVTKEQSATPIFAKTTEASEPISTPFAPTSVTALDAQQIALLEKEKIPLEKKQKVEFYGETPTEKQRSNNGWAIGLELATYASASAAVDGFAGGAVVDVPVPSEKFNLRTGLNFNTQQRYFDSQVNTGLQEDRFMGSNAVLIDPDPNLQVNAQQLSLPLTLEFRPRPSWGLEGGLQASYLLGARNLQGAEAYQTMAGFTNGNQEISTFVNSLTKNQDNFGLAAADQILDNSKVNIDAFRRFDVAFTAGFGVYPTEQIGVRLQYQRGLIDLLKADQFKTFGDNIRLSAVYFFGK